MSCSMKKNKCCTCCPYGFHIDIDFLNSLERNKISRKSKFDEQRNISEETQTQHLKNLMQGLCKYLDKITIQPENKPSNSKLTGVQPSLNGMELGQLQTVPRTLHRQNLIKTCVLGQKLSSKSFSEDEYKFRRKHSSEVARNNSMDSEMLRQPTSEELFRIRNYVDNALNRLQSLEDKDELIKNLRMKMKSERERLVINLCNKCKILLKVEEIDTIKCQDESPKEERLIQRSQSLKAYRPAINQRSKIPSYISGSPTTYSIPMKSLETNSSTNKDNISKAIDQESNHSEYKNSNHHRPRSVIMKVTPKASVQMNDSLRSNSLNSSKISQQHQRSQRSSNKQLKTNDTNTSGVEKLNLTKSISARKKLGKEPKYVSMVTRSLNDSNSFMNEVKRDISNNRGDNNNVGVEEESVSGRKEERKLCTRSLSLVTPANQGHMVILNSSSDEEMEAVKGCNSDDDQSSTSFDEGSYDGELGQIIYKQKIENLSH